MFSPARLDDREDFARILKERRAERRIRQEDLASLNRMSRFTLSDAENGRTDPKLSTMVNLLQTLGLTMVVVPTEVADRVSVPRLDGPEDVYDIDEDFPMEDDPLGPA
ncbi:helix-turn-helix domain-containing protein [Epibacterium sp. DP7N7-1]|nr:helix-turn-helix domain-containing protein [Epibacterium sp. DP7N7-1]